MEDKDKRKEELTQTGSTSEELEEEEVVEEIEDNDGIPLVVGKTKIGTLTGIYQGMAGVTFTVYYGGYITPINEDGSFKQIDRAEQLNMLTNFLNSEEGSKYAVPTEAELDEAILKVKKVQLAYQKKVAKQKAEKQEQDTAKLNEEPKQEEPSPVEDKGEQPSEEVPQTGNTSIEPQETENVSTEDVMNSIANQSDEYMFSDEINEEKEEIRQEKAETRKRNNTVPIVILFVMMFLITAGTLFISKDYIMMKFFGKLTLKLTSEQITLNFGQKFKPEEYIAFCSEGDNIIHLYPNFVADEIGEFKVEYVITDNVNTVKRNLLIKVIDIEEPVILLDKEELTLYRDEVEKTDFLSFAKVHDNLDLSLDITLSQIEDKVGTQDVVYSVTDSNGNTSTATLVLTLKNRPAPVVVTPPEETSSNSDGSSGGGSAHYSGSTTQSVPQGTSTGDIASDVEHHISGGEGEVTIDYSDYNPDVPGTYDIEIYNDDGSVDHIQIDVE